jgi:hypothetical protein
MTDEIINTPTHASATTLNAGGDNTLSLKERLAASAISKRGTTFTFGSHKTGWEKLLESRDLVKSFINSDKSKNLNGTLRSLLNNMLSHLELADSEYTKLREEHEQAKIKVNELKEGAKANSLQRTKRIASSELESTPSSKKISTNTNAVPETQWNKVVQRGIKKKQPGSKPKEASGPKTVKSKADALKISFEETNAEDEARVFQGLKSDPSLVDFRDKVFRVRRTKSGEILIELQSNPAVKSSAYKDAIQRVVDKFEGVKVKVRALTQVTDVECRNLDEFTTEDELKEALKEQFALTDDDVNLKAIRLRKSFNGTKRGTIRVTAAVANKLLEEGKIKVGWSVCELRAIKEPLKCFRCLGFGHLSKSCKGTDRTSMCWKCGSTDHKAKECKSKTSCCMLCTGEEKAHATGSLKCPVYKDAVAKLWK